MGAGAKETSPMEPRSKKTRSKNYLDVRAWTNGCLVTPFPFTSFPTYSPRVKFHTLVAPLPPTKRFLEPAELSAIKAKSLLLSFSRLEHSFPRTAKKFMVFLICPVKLINYRDHKRQR